MASWMIWLAQASDATTFRREPPGLGLDNFEPHPHAHAGYPGIYPPTSWVKFEFASQVSSAWEGLLLKSILTGAIEIQSLRNEFKGLKVRASRFWIIIVSIPSRSIQSLKVQWRMSRYSFQLRFPSLLGQAASTARRSRPVLALGAPGAVPSSPTGVASSPRCEPMAADSWVDGGWVTLGLVCHSRHPDHYRHRSNHRGSMALHLLRS